MQRLRFIETALHESRLHRMHERNPIPLPTAKENRHRRKSPKPLSASYIPASTIRLTFLCYYSDY